MAAAIRFCMQNFTLTMLILGLIAAGVSLLGKRHTSATISEALFANYLLFSIALAFLYNFVLHVFFGEMTARFIGWGDSPFQAEVGFASLGFSVVGFMAYRGSLDTRAAAVIGPACFLLGAAGGHAVQMVTAHNFAPGNAGIIFYTDIFVPVFGLLLLWLDRRYSGVRDPGNMVRRRH